MQWGPHSGIGGWQKRPPSLVEDVMMGTISAHKEDSDQTANALVS